MRRVLSITTELVVLGLLLQGCVFIHYIESRGGHPTIRPEAIQGKLSNLTLGIAGFTPDERTRKSVVLEERLVQALRESGCFKDVVYPCGPGQEVDLLVQVNYSRVRESFFLRNFWYTVFIPVAFIDGVVTHSVASMSFDISFPKRRDLLPRTIARRGEVETKDRHPFFLFSFPMYIVYHVVAMHGGGWIDRRVMTRQAGSVSRQFLAAVTDQKTAVGRQVALLLSPGGRPANVGIASGPDREGTGSPIKKRWAVVVGVSRYRDQRIPQLRYAAADARAFHEWLISPGGGGYSPDNVKLLLDEEATYPNVKNALYEWIKQAIAEDLVVVYLACHGSPPSPDEPENLYLLTYDTEYDKIASTAFPMWDVKQAIERFVRARKVIVVADACHAAGVGSDFDIQRRAGRGVGVTRVASGLDDLGKARDGIAVLMASDENQFSQEDERWGGGQGVFTYFLLEGLRGGADMSGDGRVTIGELSQYVSEQVRRDTKSAQCPKMGGVYDPQLTLGQ